MAKTQTQKAEGFDRIVKDAALNSRLEVSDPSNGRYTFDCRGLGLAYLTITVMPNLDSLNGHCAARLGLAQRLKEYYA